MRDLRKGEGGGEGGVVTGAGGDREVGPNKGERTNFELLPHIVEKVFSE